MKKRSTLSLLIASMFLIIILFFLQAPVNIQDDPIPAGPALSTLSPTHFPSSTTVYVTQLSSILLFKSQFNTGIYSANNCGPTSLYMILAWLGKSPQNPESIRSQLKQGDGWIYTDEITSYLDKQNIPYETKRLLSSDDLLKLLDNGILLLCMDISKVSFDTSSKTTLNAYPPLIKQPLTGKESTSGTGHFIVATGYYIQNNMTYIEVLDPLNSSVRYYELSELFKATKDWYHYCFLFKK